MGFIHKFLNTIKADGLILSLKKAARYVCVNAGQVYRDHLWTKLPEKKKPGVQNGVIIPSHQRRPLDKIVPWYTPSYIPNFKSTNITQVKENVKEGDTVVSIGGGRGVTNTVEADKVGPNGHVIIFEGSEERIEILKETLKCNDVDSWCDVTHGIVGDPQFIPNNDSRSTIVQVDELPECDVLEMDCEGSELSILRNLTQLPRVIIIETHQDKAYAPYSDSKDICQLLEEYGYSVEEFNGPWVNGLLVGSFTSEH